MNYQKEDVYMKCKIMFFVLCFLIIILGGTNTFAEQYFPLKEGMSWEYQMTRQGRFSGVETSTYTRKALAARKFDEVKLVPLQYNNGFLQYIIQDKFGVAVYAYQGIDDVKPKASRPIYYFLQYPLKQGAIQQTRFKTDLLEMQVDVDVTLTIETLSDTVSVPAGTFKNCIRIKGYGTKTIQVDIMPVKATIEIETYEWYAPNVGWIKSIMNQNGSHPVLGGPGQEIHQLLKFTK